MTTIAAITAYLTAADSGADDDNPVPLAAARNLTTDWQNLFNAIEAAGKYVSLDLTACAMANMTDTTGEFDPGPTGAGANLIVSLVLPAEATMIGGYDRALFMQFTSLKTVRGSAVTIIGDWTFRFCHALTTADFPQVTSIGDYAFDGCAALTTVDFPLVTSIGRDAFQNTGNKTLVITLPQNAPILSSGNSSSYTYSKTVTIKTPAGRTGYDSAWESLFKAAFDTQASITLIFEDP